MRVSCQGKRDCRIDAHLLPMKALATSFRPTPNPLTAHSSSPHTTQDDGEAKPLALEAGGGGGGSVGSPGPLAISDGKGADSGAMVPYGE